MRPIEDINDLGQLKQVAVLLDQENARLHTRLLKLTAELARLRGEDAQEAVQLELEKLQVELAKLQRRGLGNPSERRGKPDEGAEDKASNDAPQPKGHGPRAQPKLPLRDELHELSEDARTCPACDKQLQEWPGQFEESEEVTVVQRRFELVTHRRKKYRCRCNAAVVTAPGPVKLIPGGRYSLEFALQIAIDKYLDHMPLERQVRAMQRHGLIIDSQTLWDQILALADKLKPSLLALRQHVFRHPLVHADETWWRLMNGDKPKNWWSWCASTKDAAYYQILETRSNESAIRAFAGYSGTLLVDGYAVYKSLAKAGVGFTLAHCWVHARRHFVEIEESYPVKCKEIIGLIGELYAVERMAPGSMPEAEALDLLRELRSERSRPIIDHIRTWAYEQRCTPASELRKAIDYMLRIWSGLTRFLDDPRIPLDNNPAERALRGQVLGRKNHYGSRSIQGTEVAALFYSLLETAKLCGVDPAFYLKTAALKAIGSPESALLPHDLLD